MNIYLFLENYEPIACMVSFLPFAQTDRFNLTILAKKIFDIIFTSSKVDICDEYLSAIITVRFPSALYSLGYVVQSRLTLGPFFPASD